MLKPQHTQSSEPIPARRIAALKSVEVQTKMHTQFAEKYGFIDSKNKADIDGALNYLKTSFFSERDLSERNITNFHLTQIITVALETNLNPYINDLYGIWNGFGELKVFATMDGWMKIATSEKIEKREFIYSDNSVQVEIDGHTYNVPEWIECQLEHAEKGSSQAREYFWEVFNNAQHHLPSWSRPARQLSHVAFIQALRKMLRISSLCDSDMIVDMTKEYEALSMQQKSISTPMVKAKATNVANDLYKTTASVATTAKSNRKLNINIDDIDIEVVKESASSETQTDPKQNVVEETVKSETAQTEQLTESVKPIETDGKAQTETRVETVANATVETKGKATSNNTECQVDTSEPTEDIVSELMVNRTIVQIIKPFMARCKQGQLSIEDLMAKRSIISDELGQRWFDQEVEKLR